MTPNKQLNKIPSFQVRTRVTGPYVEAAICFSSPVPRSARFAFYLMKDRKPKWRGRYTANSTASFEIEHAGSYIVKVFVTLGDEKRTCSSDSFTVTEESIESAATSDHAAPPKLSFTPLDLPHRDFALLSMQEEFRSLALPDLTQLIGENDLLHAEWTTTHGPIDVISAPHSRVEGGEVLMSGFARTENRLIYGAADLAGVEPERIHESNGDFTLATHHPWGAEIRTDYFGIGRVYYFESPDFTCVSNRYHLLLLLTAAAGVDLGIDTVRARANLQAVNQPFTQLFSSAMEVSGCRAMRVGEILELRGQSLTVAPSEIVSVLNQATNQKPSVEEYRDRVSRAAEEITDNLRVALEHPAFNAVRIDVTGGMDARLVFSALAQLNRFRDKVHIHTADVAGSPYDLRISLALTGRRSFEYDTVPRQVATISSATSLAENLSFHLGTYYGIRPETARSRLPGTLRINGFYGEICARPYFARQVFGRPAEQLDTGDFATEFVRGILKAQRPIAAHDELVSLFREEFERLPGDVPAAKIDAFYLFYRNGLHCSDRWLDHTLAPGWGPLQSKELFALKWSTFTRDKNIQLQIDVTEALDAELALLPIGRQKDNADRGKLDSRYAVAEGAIDASLDLTAADFTRYEEARVRRGALTAKFISPKEQQLAVINARFADTHKGWVLHAITALMDTYGILSAQESKELTEYFLAEFGSSDSRLTMPGLVISNKILSLYHQCALVGKSHT